jgi:hypothetical protein
MPPIHLILLVFAFVLAVVGAFWNPPRATLGWLSVACLALAELVP